MKMTVDGKEIQIINKTFLKKYIAFAKKYQNTERALT